MKNYFVVAVLCYSVSMCAMESESISTGKIHLILEIYSKQDQVVTFPRCQRKMEYDVPIEQSLSAVIASVSHETHFAPDDSICYSGTNRPVKKDFCKDFYTNEWQQSPLSKWFQPGQQLILAVYSDQALLPVHLAPIQKGRCLLY